MTKNPRFLVVRVDLRPNTSGDELSMRLWPQCATAVLACGHQINCGVSVEYAQRTKRMACADCGIAQRSAMRQANAQGETRGT